MATTSGERPVRAARSSKSRASSGSSAFQRVSAGPSGGGTRVGSDGEERRPVARAVERDELLAAEEEQDVVEPLAETGSVAQQAMAPGVGAPVDGARHREDVATEVGGEAGRDERAAVERRLDDDDRAGQRRHDAVAAGEVPGVGARPRRMLGQQGPARGDLAGERGVLGRVDDVDAAAQHAHRRSPARERAGVRRAVDPPREPADDDDAGARQGPPERMGDPEPVRRGPARPHDRDRGAIGGR